MVRSTREGVWAEFIRKAAVVFFVLCPTGEPRSLFVLLLLALAVMGCPVVSKDMKTG